MKKIIYTNILLNATALNYLIAGYQNYANFLFIISLIMLGLCFNQTSYKRILFFGSLLFLISFYYAYKGGLNHSTVNYFCLIFSVSFSSAYFFEILNTKAILRHKVVDKLQLLTLVFVFFMVLSILVPDYYLDIQFYPFKRLSLLTLLVISFCPYILVIETIYLAKYFKKC